MAASVDENRSLYPARSAAGEIAWILSSLKPWRRRRRAARGGWRRRPSYGSYMESAMLLRRLRGRLRRASLSAYAFSATLTAMASEILRISVNGG